jgi:hypothetical protein
MTKASTHSQVKAYISPEKHRKARIAAELLEVKINAVIDDLIDRAQVKL